jgi:hypothetical protein
MINDINKRALNWRFTLVLIKINYGQIGYQTGLFYTTNPVFYTSGNRFVRRTGTFGNLIFSLVTMCRFIVCIVYIHRYTSFLTEAALTKAVSTKAAFV